MKDYFTIHINKNTMKAIWTFTYITSMLLVGAFMFFCTMQYLLIENYDDGYNALANEIKEGMEQTECGRFMLLSMKDFDVKLYQEQCLFLDWNRNNDKMMTGNIEFFNVELNDAIYTEGEKDEN